MKNFIQPGEKVTLTMPYARTSGQGVKVGLLFGVCTGDFGNATEGEVMTEGVFYLNKTSAQAWTQGAVVFWDDTAKEVTTVATANLRIGIAAKAAANPTANGYVLLTQPAQVAA